MLIQLNYENKEKKSFDKHGFCSLAVVSWERGIVCVGDGDSRRAPRTGSFLAVAPEANTVTSSSLQHRLGVECQGFLEFAAVGSKVTPTMYSGFLHYMIVLFHCA